MEAMDTSIGISVVSVWSCVTTATELPESAVRLSQRLLTMLGLAISCNIQPCYTQLAQLIKVKRNISKSLSFIHHPYIFIASVPGLPGLFTYTQFISACKNREGLG